jgi:signal peptidase I
MNIAEILLIALFLIYFVSLPAIFKKAGKPAWHGFVPVLQYITWLKVIGRPWYWVFLLFIPGVNLLVFVIMTVELAIVFNLRSTKDQWYFGALPWVALIDMAFKMKDIKWVGPRDWSKKKKGIVREWGEAILFAVIAATVIRTLFFEAFTIPTGSMEGSMLVGDYLFVSKMSYGAKLQQTPLSVPFVHNAMPGSLRNSYVEWIQLPYWRLPGFGSVNRYDPVVFNFPHGDTVLAHPALVGHDYYARIRDKGIELARSYEVYNNDPERFNQQARNFYLNYPGSPVPIKGRPVDKTENYIKRCMALPGEVIEIRNRQIIIDGKPVDNPQHAQYDYVMKLKNPATFTKVKESLGLTNVDFEKQPGTNVIIESMVSLTADEKVQLEAMGVLDTLYVEDQSRLRGTMAIFPNSLLEPYNTWDSDNFGPVHIPAAGETIALDAGNLPIYRRAIAIYEGNDLEERDGQIYINGSVATSYTFKYNYYWLMGDNRHNSADSRFWGFVPETHVVGKAVFTWFSKQNANDHGVDGIRWNRMFRTVQ